MAGTPEVRARMRPSGSEHEQRRHAQDVVTLGEVEVVGRVHVAPAEGGAFGLDLTEDALDRDARGAGRRAEEEGDRLGAHGVQAHRRELAAVEAGVVVADLADLSVAAVPPPAEHRGDGDHGGDDRAVGRGRRARSGRRAARPEALPDEVELTAHADAGERQERRQREHHAHEDPPERGGSGHEGHQREDRDREPARLGEPGRSLGLGLGGGPEVEAAVSRTGRGCRTASSASRTASPGRTRPSARRRARPRPGPGRPGRSRGPGSSRPHRTGGRACR